MKAYVREDHEIEKFHKESDLIFKIQQKAEKILIFNSPVMQLSVYGCILLISWLGAHMIVGGSMTTGELMSLFTYTTSILMSLMMLSMVFVMVIMSVASAQRIAEVINQKSSLTSPENGLKEVKNGDIVFDHVYFKQGDAANLFSKIDKVDALIVDPPRSGLDSPMKKAILKKQPDQILYVSCNPSTLAKDIADLKTVYAVERIRPFDMFSQTQHVETIVSLRRIQSKK